MGRATWEIERTLGADNVDADVEGFRAMLNGSDHVHHEDSSCVKFVDDLLRGHTDGANEESGLLGDDNVDELVELPSSVCRAA